MEIDHNLRQFIETDIIPQYKAFGRSHGVEHAERVIANSLALAGDVLAAEHPDINMVYAIAAYHDLGMSGPREIHHITGGKILSEDSRLAEWFSPEQIKVMKEAVEDHRASSGHTPRSLYGMILAEADRDLEPETVFRRAVEFGLEHEPEYGKEKQWERFSAHMDEKYSVNGYMTLFIPGSPNQRFLEELHEIIADKKRLRLIFDRIFEEVR